MSVRVSIERLQADMAALRAGLAALSRRAADTPPDNAGALAQALADAGDSMTGWASEACDSLASPYFDGVSAHLVRAHRRTLQIAAGMDEWTSYDRVADVAAVGAEGGSPGRDWSLDVRDALDSCRHQLNRVERRVFAAWLELSEAGLGHGVSVQAVSVGQQLSLPPDSEKATTGGESGAAGSE
jgi:hypothetical protein